MCCPTVAPVGNIVKLQRVAQFFWGGLFHLWPLCDAAALPKFSCSGVSFFHLIVFVTALSILLVFFYLYL